MPSGPVEHDEGMGAGFDGEGDLGEMSVECLRVGVRHDETGGLAFHRTYGAEDVGRDRSLVLGR